MRYSVVRNLDGRSRASSNLFYAGTFESRDDAMARMEEVAVSPVICVHDVWMGLSPIMVLTVLSVEYWKV